MFWSKKKVEPRDVACVTCGCIVLKSKVHKVRHSGGSYMDAEGRVTHYIYDDYNYCCSRCKPPYDEVQHLNVLHYYLTIPAKRIEVDEKGKEIKKS